MEENGLWSRASGLRRPLASNEGPACNGRTAQWQPDRHDVRVRHGSSRHGGSTTAAITTRSRKWSSTARFQDRSGVAWPRSAKMLHSHALGGQNRMKTEHFQRSCHSRRADPDAGPPANARSNVLERTRRNETTQCNNWSHNVNLAWPCIAPNHLT